MMFFELMADSVALLYVQSSSWKSYYCCAIAKFTTRFAESQYYRGNGGPPGWIPYTRKASNHAYNCVGCVAA